MYIGTVDGKSRLRATSACCSFFAGSILAGSIPDSPPIRLVMAYF
jgi:hypothetical protein